MTDRLRVPFAWARPGTLAAAASFCPPAQSGIKRSIQPETLGDMRALGVRLVYITCSACGYASTVNVDDRQDVVIRSLGLHVQCTKCGNLGVIVQPGWTELRGMPERRTMMIDGFSIELHTTDTFLFWRVAGPQHEYIIKLDSEHIELLQIVPAAVSDGDPEVDPRRFEGEVLKAANKFQDQLFPKAQSV